MGLTHARAETRSAILSRSWWTFIFLVMDGSVRFNGSCLAAESQRASTCRCMTSGATARCSSATLTSPAQRRSSPSRFGLRRPHRFARHSVAGQRKIEFDGESSVSQFDCNLIAFDLALRDFDRSPLEGLAYANAAFAYANVSVDVCNRAGSPPFPDKKYAARCPASIEAKQAKPVASTG
jgi:hypothetical protein